MKKRRIAALAAFAGLTAVLAATVSPGGSAKTNAPAQGGSLSIISLWGGSEKDAFVKLTKAFTKKTKIAVRYETQRN